MIITDLPYDMTFDDFEKLLNKYLETAYIKDWKNFSNGDKNIKIQINHLKEEQLLELEELILKWSIIK